MMKSATTAALILVTGCAAQTQTPSYTELAPPPPAYAGEPARAVPPAPLPAPGVDCDIRTSRTAHGLQIRAVAHAGRPVHGEYDFVITALGSGGSSDISQGGPLHLSAGQSDTVGYAEIPRGRYRAVLTLSDADGELCRSERRS